MPGYFMPSGIEVLCSVAILWQTTASVHVLNQAELMSHLVQVPSWDKQLYILSGALGVVHIYQCLSMPGTHSSSFGMQI